MASVPKEFGPPQHHHHPSSSATSLAKSDSTARSQKAGPSTIKTVITAPPWARDEPPSPTEDDTVNGGGLLHPSLTRRPSEGQSPRPSDVTSFRSQSPTALEPSRWWAFAPHPHRQHHQGTTDQPSFGAPPPPQTDDDDRTPTQTGAAGFRSLVGLALKERSRSWLAPHGNHATDKGRESDGAAMPTPIVEEDERPQAPQMDRGLTIRLPATPAIPYTMHQANTPGWQSPWTPRAARAEAGDYWNLGNGNGFGDTTDPPDRSSSPEKATGWAKTRKTVRSFLLNNIYVPLLFRFINITFTSAALAESIRIRNVERKHHIVGATGSSVLIVIIFAPLTLAHVLGAIYSEYFGKPLGLWRTSHKLAHTLIEVLYICAWSAALSLSFDNYYTSYLPCTPLSDIDWWNELPRPSPPLSIDAKTADQLCDDQLVLISLVFIGLVMYCINLIISLFRIFEKVKHYTRTG